MRVSWEIGQNWLPLQVGENNAGDLVGLSQRPVMVLRGGFPELDPRLFAPLSDVITCGRAAMFLTCVCGFWIECGCVLTCGLSWMFCGLRLHFYGPFTSTGYVHRREFPLCTVKPLVPGGTHDTHRNFTISSAIFRNPLLSIDHVAFEFLFGDEFWLFDLKPRVLLTNRRSGNQHLGGSESREWLVTFDDAPRRSSCHRVFDRSDRDAAQEFLWFKVCGTGLAVDDNQSYESLTWRYHIGACHGAENMIRIQGGLVLAGSVQFRLVMAGFVMEEGFAAP